ncbi:MAG: hypothetical protein ACTSUZ_06935 [Candidatus Thorarchaeota archaeon]
MSEEGFDEAKLRFMFKYWKMTLVFIVIAAVAVIVGTFVLLWQVDIAIVPATLGQWSVGIVISFCLNLVFWELVLVGSWVAVLAIIIYFQWYSKLPDEDKKKWDGRGNRESSDAIGFFIGIAWLIMLWIDGGRWNLPFDSWTFVDWVWSWLYAAFWVAIIGGIIVLIGIIAWVAKEKGIEA